jgi:hypothetical protein
MSKLEQLLDKSIDDIDDLPGFEVPNNGMYNLKLNISEKNINQKDCIEAAFEVVECLEQNDPAKAPTTPGTKFSTLFFYENEVGLSKLKEFFIPFCEYLGEKNLMRAIIRMKEEKDLLIAARVKQVVDRKDADKIYADVGEIVIA